MSSYGSRVVSGDLTDIIGLVRESARSGLTRARSGLTRARSTARGEDLHDEDVLDILCRRRRVGRPGLGGVGRIAIGAHQDRRVDVVDGDLREARGLPEGRLRGL